MAETEQRGISRRKFIGVLGAGVMGGAIVGAGSTIGITEFFFNPSSDKRLPEKLKYGYFDHSLYPPLESGAATETFDTSFDEIFGILKDTRQYNSLSNEVIIRSFGPDDLHYLVLRKEVDTDNPAKVTRTLIRRYGDNERDEFYVSENGQIVSHLRNSGQSKIITEKVDDNKIAFLTSNLLVTYECFAIDYNRTGSCK